MTQMIIRERVAFNGSRGRIAGELAFPESTAAGMCLLMNPHPHMGGNIENNVIAHLAERLSAHELAVLRFDYAGIGESEGEGVDFAKSMQEFWETNATSKDEAMVDDAAAALAWLNAQLNLPCAMIGYSFGAYVASQLVNLNTNALVLINPTLKQHQYVIDGQHPTLVIYSDNDFATPVEHTEAWLNTKDASILRCCISGGEHFYRNMESQVGDAVLKYLKSHMTSEQGRY